MFENAYKRIEAVSHERAVFIEASTPEEIWKEVLEQDKQTIVSLFNAMRQLVYEVGVPKWLVELSAAGLYHGIYRWWGHYVKESDYFADHFSPLVSHSLMAFLQRQYTLAHMGCSVVMAWDDQAQQMVHYRSLDWKGAEDIALATRRFKFINAKGNEVAKVAGVAAMMGVLTGVKQGFSISINYAPWKRSARFQSDPTFKIRQLLEDESINSFEAALEAVKTWKVGSPCFISLCGVLKGEAAVVELSTSSRVHVRHMGEKEYLVQTNHYDLQSSPFVEHNETPYTESMNEQEWYEGELLQHSQQRACVLEEAMAKRDGPLCNALNSAYLQVPVLNWESAQLVVMRPKNADMDLYACFDA